MSGQIEQKTCAEIVGMMIDYNLIMWIGLGLIVGGFCLFLYSQHRLRQLDIEEFKNQQLTESFNKAKKGK